MAYFPQNRKDGGFASIAALAISLAIALVVSAVTLRSVASLRLARNDLEKLKSEYVLDGVHLLAATRILEGVHPGRLEWTMSTDEGQAYVLAEQEVLKANPQLAATIDSALLGRLGAKTPNSARVALVQLGPDRVDPAALRAIDPSPRWRACAPSAFSSYGKGALINLGKLSAPVADASAARAGEVWRIAVTGASGWVDERLVRVTGDQRRPSSLIWRSFRRPSKGALQCDTVIPGP